MLTKRSSAILSIGNVNTKTGKNAMFGSIWDCWEENAAYTNVLCRSYDGKLLVAHTCGGAEPYVAGEHIAFHHDQTRRAMGEWEILGAFPHTKDDLVALGKLAGTTSIRFYTFK